MNNNKIQAVVFDWAGTTVDYGCIAPVAIFIEVFKKRGIEITLAEAREPMGLQKRDHIVAICNMPRVANLWHQKFDRKPLESEIDEMYNDFENMIFQILSNYAQPIPGVLNLMERLRAKGIKIGSTTGYTKDMIKIVAAEAKKQGYEPDYLVTSEDVPGGRPYPWMCYENAMHLGVYPMSSMMKVGDTVIDMQDGRNAGMWTVGVVLGGSELGLTQEEVEAMEPQLLEQKMEEVRQRLIAAGAHFTIDSIGDLDKVIEKIEMGEIVYQ